jgi:hypothetical protein
MLIIDFLFYLFFREEKKQLAKIKAELFDRKQSLMKHAAVAPVAASIKERLTNIEDLEITQS